VLLSDYFKKNFFFSLIRLFHFSDLRYSRYSFYWHIITTTFKSLVRGRLYVIYVKMAIDNRDHDDIIEEVISSNIRGDRTLQHVLKKTM
jgi:DNA-binding GntR family transcriptional regulator